MTGLLPDRGAAALRYPRPVACGLLLLLVACGGTTTAGAPDDGTDQETSPEMDVLADAPEPPDEAGAEDAITGEDGADGEDGEDSADGAEEAPPDVRTGVLVGGTGDWPGGIGGVHFRSGAQEGYTDPSGSFTYEEGMPIVFGVADVEFRPTDGSEMLSPWQLAADGECVQSLELERLLVLLQSLDEDDDPSTGTNLAHDPPEVPARSLSSLGDDDVAALIARLIPGRTPVDTADAVNRFITQMDGEIWTPVSMETFDTINSAERSQGVTTDGTYWYFSWRLGLQKTDLDGNVVMSNALAIPLILALQGSDHIGDIDCWGGHLYVPIEDSASYSAPKVVLFDLDLNAGTVFSIPNTLLTEGVPWVAVDGPRDSVYLAEWNPTPAIFVFALGDLTYRREIPLSTTLGRIQGAKVFEGALYANADDDGKTAYKINLETGTVIELFALHASFEVEGLALLARPDGTLLHTLNATPTATAMEFRHYARTREPLRKLVCF